MNYQATQEPLATYFLERIFRNIMPVSFRETMSNILNTVSVLGLPSNHHSVAPVGVTISSLVSAAVQEGQEEILFVLKNNSYAGEKLVAGKGFSINVLSESQKSIAESYATRQSTSEETYASFQLIWSDIETFPKLNGAHIHLKCLIKESYVRDLSTVFFASILDHESSPKTKPLLHFQRDYHVIGTKAQNL